MNTQGPRAPRSAALPTTLPVATGVALDAVYAPAVGLVESGGDWCDAVVLDATHLLLCVGDVACNGPHAIDLMEVLRGTLRALAGEVRSPLELLRRLDAVLRSEDEEAMVTAFVGILDLETRRMTYANAGHPPPLLRSSDGSVAELSIAETPLGLRVYEGAAEARAALEPGSLLVLYTDGLIEGGRNVNEGETALWEALRDSTITRFRRPALALQKTLAPRPTRDDVVVLTVTVSS